MSSIAYITDRDMIDYHRLHGNQTIAFWRPSAQKNFQHFQLGDYLFFLTKGTEKGKEREKGIIGYGRLAAEETRSIKQMWERYETMCGYASEEAFQNAVISVNKTHTLPKQIHVLLLERVIFFQAPIYLSEFAMHISKQIESYVYLDTETQTISEQLLIKAMDIGTDMWNTNAEDGLLHLKQDRDIIAIQALRDKIQTNWCTPTELKKLRSFAMSALRQKNGRFLSCGKEDFVFYENHTLCFCIPCILTRNQWKHNLLYCIAKAILYRNTLQKKGSSSTVKILLDDDHEQAKALCTLADVTYEILTKP